MGLSIGKREVNSSVTEDTTVRGYFFNRGAAKAFGADIKKQARLFSRSAPFCSGQNGAY
jgi:hypothetical protein